jgi:hypothetical protein
MKMDEMVCCSWHKPRNAIVELKTGKMIAKKLLRAVPDSPEKELMMGSGGMCDPCAANFTSGSKFAKRLPQGEDLFGKNDVLFAGQKDASGSSQTI